MSEGTPPNEVALICPHCGYDLRMIESERCPECGETIDRTAGAQPTIPWALRRHRGRIRSYLATVWMVTLGTRKLGNEFDRRVSYRDARRFWWLTSFFVSIPLMVVFAAIWLKEGHAAAQFPGFSLFGTGPSADVLTRFYDLEYPWRLGAQFSPLMLVWIFFAVLTNLGMPSYLMDRLHHGERRGRAIALSYYSSGALFGFALFGMIGAGYFWASHFANDYRTRDNAEPMALLFFAIAPLFILLYWWRTESLVSRLSPGGRAGWWAVFALPVCWSLNWAWWLVALPWLIGYLWILIWTW